MTKTQRNRRSSKPTLGVTMAVNDAVKTSDAGLGFDANGQPFITNQAGTKVMDFVTANVRSPMVIKMTLPVQVALTGALSGGTLLNPFGYDVLITAVYVRVTTQSTGASTVDMGVAADAATTNDGLIDGLSLAAAGLFNNIEDPGTNGELSMVWSSTQYFNIFEASGDVAGFAGAVYIECIRL